MAKIYYDYPKYNFHYSMVFEQGGLESGIKSDIRVGSKVVVQEADGSQSFDWQVVTINPGNGRLHVRRDMTGGEDEEKWVEPSKVSLANPDISVRAQVEESSEIAEVMSTLKISPDKQIVPVHDIFGSELTEVAVPRTGASTELWTLSYVVLNRNGLITSIVVTSPLEDGIKLFDIADFLKYNRSWAKRVNALSRGNQETPSLKIR